MKWLEKLKLALLIITIKGEIRQLQSYAMGRVPEGYSRWSIASTYLYDVERIMQELKTSHSFVSKLPDKLFFDSYSVNSEDYVMYHQGYFLDLTHQLKDKICQLIKAVSTPKKDYSKKDEKKTSVNKLLKDENVYRVLNIVKYIKEWSDEGEGVIALVLKKRTHYHHFRNPLSGAKNYLQARTHRFLLSPAFYSRLSDYGRQMITARGQKSFESWQFETSQKMSNTLEAIDANIDNISKSLLDYFRFPLQDNETTKRVMLQYPKLDDLVTVKDSPCSKHTMQPGFSEIFELLANTLKTALPKDFVSLYIVGSVARGEFVFGQSDVNIIVVIGSDDVVLKELVHKFTSDVPTKFMIPIDAKVISREEFISNKNRKLRFICKTDGVLYDGEDILPDEWPEKICFKLAWMLNSDYKDYIAQTRAKLEGVKLKLEETTLIARQLAKRTYRMGFAQLIGNNIRYASSFKKMRELQNILYPQNRVFNEFIYKIFSSKRLVVDQVALLDILNIFEKNLFPLYDAIDKTVNIK